jgi:predicted permease
MFRRMQRRLRYWLHRDERARLLQEEMDAHREMIAQELRDAGMPEAEARAAARRQFGNATLLQEQSRSTWIARWLSDLVQDAAFGARTIRQRPAFAAVAALSATLGIGACSTIFAIANFALFHPLPVSDPSRLLGISGANTRAGRSGQTMSYPDFLELRQAPSFQRVAAFFPFLPATIASGGEPQHYWGSLVTGNYFDVVRPPFAVGHGFDPARDDRQGETPAVVLGYSLWRSRFGGDPSIAGRTIDMNGRKVTVVGVTAAGFQGTEGLFFSDFWLPFSMLSSLSGAGLDAKRLVDRDGQWLLAAGRLRDGATPQAAAAELDGIGKRIAAAYPATHKDRTFHSERAGQINPGMRKMVFVLFMLLLGVSAMVLCTACANVANLLLARAAARQKEIATRLAIGAGRGRLVRQLLTESVMLALLGGAGGYALARLGASSIGRSRLPISVPINLSIALDYKVTLFCAALAVVTGVIFGLVPALRATRPNLLCALKDDGGCFGNARRFGLRNLLVVGQVSICMVLLICSGLFLRSLGTARDIETGLTHRSVLLLAFDASLNGHGQAQLERLTNGMLERTGALPGVESVSLTSSVPLNMEGTQNAFSPEGDTERDTFRRVADIYSVSPQFFDTFGIRLIAGEIFGPGAPADDIAIANQALVEAAFPKQNPVGRRIRYLGRTVRITGVVATTKSRTIGEDPRPCLYFPIAKDIRGNDSLTGITLAVRTRHNPAAYAQPVRQIIRDLDPSLAVFDIRTMDQQLSQALFLPRTAASLFGLAGFMGLLISTIGIYGVISFMVARQTHEIGIRMALGARRSQVLGMVLRHGLLLTVAGSVIGLGVAMALSRVAASLLYGVSPTDGVTFVAVPALIVTVALLACLAPARRAASLDPIRALRYD